MSTTILVMDDDESMRELLALHLRNAGYQVLLAEDAIVAGQMVVKHRPDLLIADVEMPYMDGLQFVEALRGDPAVSATPVIFLTSRTDIAQRAAELGALGYLTKPVLADRLLSDVAKYISGGRQPIG